MSDRMRPVPFRELLLRITAECRARGSVFDIPVEHFWFPTKRETAHIFTGEAANPVGPAAGPHTQLAQNIVCAWLTGGRYIELKTVQIRDALEIEKPCIDAADEGYNVEWSTELSLDQAFEEYLKAWMLVHVLQALMGPGPGSPGTLFNMSVGYDLAGIKSEPMDRFIGRLIDSSHEPLFARCQSELTALARDPALLAGTPWVAKAFDLRALPSRITGSICRSVTLSTMHGCPPGETESICAYLLTEKGLDTLVKLNPTLLGYEQATEILAGLGYGYVSLKPEGFRKDLQRTDAVPMLTRLLALAGRQGRHFGAKLSNTLAAANDGGVLPGAEKYMSGRALYPLTISLAASLAEELRGGLPISFCGGAAAWNLGDILDAGMRPVTVATELLKPGGYSRMKELAEIAEAHASSWGAPRVDPARVRAAAERALRAAPARKDFRGTGRVGVPGALPLFDCFVAPCIDACAIRQDVPEYIHLAGAARYAEALDAICRKNPLPFMTAYLCDHQCMENCTRRDWEGAVSIREMKRIAAERGWEQIQAGQGAVPARTAGPRGVKAAVIGAGPAGLAAASFLAREGFESHVFERESEPGGIVRWVLPSFRIPAGAVEKDVALVKSLGVQVHCGEKRVPTAAALQERGFRYVLVGIGAEADKDIGVPGAMEVLPFLRRFRSDPAALRLGRSVAVIGAGDTAMDAARAALRCPGVKDVRIVYRRTEREMPASPEEYRSALDDGVGFHFLRAPARWSRGEGLVCTVMEMGSADESGRSTPVSTGATEAVAADTVIAAVGAEVDADALAALGVDAESAARGIFVIGDSSHGPATIVRGIASARTAVDAICAREGGSRAPSWRLAAEDTGLLRAARDRVIPGSAPGADDDAARQTESSRCLGCRAICLKCVEVCPNRANTAVRVGNGFRDELQIVHLDALCNECGTCATFCPWEGKPYRDKLTVFSGAQDFHDSVNPGFFLQDGRGLGRFGGRVRTLAADATGNVAAGIEDEPTRAVVNALARDHRYLFGGASS